MSPPGLEQPPSPLTPCRPQPRGTGCAMPGSPGSSGLHRAPLNSGRLRLCVHAPVAKSLGPPRHRSCAVSPALVSPMGTAMGTSCFPPGTS